MSQESDLSHDMSVDNRIQFGALEGSKIDTRRLSDMYWAQKGWTSGNRNGAYVGCPELPDGSKLTSAWGKIPGGSCNVHNNVYLMLQLI